MQLHRGMADRGNGIRLFNSRETLTKIFEEFEDDSEDEDEAKDVGTGVVTSQLRHFVVQVLYSFQTAYAPMPYNADRSTSIDHYSSTPENDPSIPHLCQKSSKDIKSEIDLFVAEKSV